MFGSHREEEMHAVKCRNNSREVFSVFLGYVKIFERKVGERR
jgi:hypothetical protein